MSATDTLLLALSLLVFNVSVSIRTQGLKATLLKNKSFINIWHLIRVSLPLFVFRYIVAYVLIVRLFVNFEANASLAITIVVSLATLSALCFTFTQAATGYVISKNNDFFNRADIEQLKAAVFSSGIGFFQATIYFGIGFAITFGAYNVPEPRENFQWLSSILVFTLRVMALIFLSISATFSVRALETTFLSFDRELFDWPWARPWWASDEYTNEDKQRTIKRTIEKRRASTQKEDR